MAIKLNTVVWLKLLVVVVMIGFAVIGAGNFGARIQTVSSASEGPSASHTDAPGEDNCTSCHTSFAVNTGSGNVAISGLPAVYVPGQQISVTVTTSQADAVIYGFQMTAINADGEKIGTFTLPNENPERSKIVTGIVQGRERKYVEHTSSGLFLPNTFGFNRWNFTWTAPPTRAGRVRFYVAGNGSDSDATPSGDYIYTATNATTSGSPLTDFDADGKTDLSIFRPGPVTGAEWWFLRSSNGTNGATQFGASSDTIVPADYTGDNKTDIAFWRPSTGFWFVLRSEDFSFYSFPFGATGDVPVPADYDGDGKSDAAVFRESAVTWFINKSSGGTDIVGFGAAGDKPVNADYDGDGKSDVAIYRPNGPGGAEWWVRRSSNASVFALVFGSPTDKAVAGDYTGDGKADVAFWRPATGNWFVLRSEDSSFFAFPFGSNGDTPVPGDYDGDGKLDAGVFRPSSSTWFLNRSTAGTLIQQFGGTGDIPLPRALLFGEVRIRSLPFPVLTPAMYRCRN